MLCILLLKRASAEMTTQYSLLLAGCPPTIEASQTLLERKSDQGAVNKSES